MELQPGTIDYHLQSPLSVKESVDYMFDRLMQTLPNDNAKLFFLQSEKIRLDPKYAKEVIYVTSPTVNPEYVYYFQIKDKLNQLQEQYEQIRL